MRGLLALLLAIGVTAPAWADEVAASDPRDLSVTIYRDPARGQGGAIDLNRLGGFAVVTETRLVTLPAGKHRLRFVGVVDGILPESAIVTGLPGSAVAGSTLTDCRVCAASGAEAMTMAAAVRRRMFFMEWFLGGFSAKPARPARWWRRSRR